jgi:hypothetical protein
MSLVTLAGYQGLPVSKRTLGASGSGAVPGDFDVAVGSAEVEGKVAFPTGTGDVGGVDGVGFDTPDG